MEITLPLSKMHSVHETSVKYFLNNGAEKVDVTSLIGKEVELKFTGKILCSNCGKTTKKSYGQGFCYPCTMKLASCDMCILRPETCHFAQGTCREPAWGEEHCFKPHVVYIANSSGPKVGITRRTQVPTRWIDQGATQALPILEVKDRLTSGLIEVLFKKHIADKTDWRKMLKGEPEHMDMLAWKEKLLKETAEELQKFEFKILDEPEYHFDYPVTQYPQKVSSLGLDKTPEIKSRLLGIKGQYMIFEAGVFNVRSHAGYQVTLKGDYASIAT